MSDLRARVIVGLILFCGVPAVVGVLLVGWGGLIFAFAAPAFVLVMTLVLGLGLLIEWVLGGSPGQQRDRARG